MNCKISDRDRLITGYLLNELSDEERIRFEAHLLGCKMCFNEARITEDSLYLLKQEKHAIFSKSTSTSLWQQIGFNFTKYKPGQDNGKTARWSVGLAAASAIVIVVCIMIMFFFLDNPYSELAQVNQKQFNIAFRGNESNLDNTLSELKNGNHSSAIAGFEKLLHSHPDNYDLHYYKGIAHLLNAPQSVFGLIEYSYDLDEINASIEHLNKALSYSRGNQRYQENCYWFIGKAHLMREDIDSAITNFENIIKLDQLNLNRQQDAMLILDQIRNLQ